MLTFSQFSKARALSKGAPFRVYGVWGDAYLQERVVSSLLDWTLDADARDFNLDTLDGDGATLNDVFAACGNAPFLSERRGVIVRRAEKLEGLGRTDGAEEKPKKGKKSGLSPTARLAAELDALAPTTVLILCRTPESPDAGGKAGTRCLGAIPDKAIEKNGLLISCGLGARDNTTVSAIIQREATERGIVLDDRAANHLVERGGLDIAHLLNELEKCALRASGSVHASGHGDGVAASNGRNENGRDDGRITPHIIDEMTRPALQDTIYNLADALGERQTARAIAMSRELIGDGEAPERILSSLASHLRKLLQARAVLDAGLRLDASLPSRMPPALMAQLPRDGRENIATIVSGQSWRAGKLASQARNFSQEQLARALEGALEVDLALKGIEGDGGAEGRKLPELMLELWLAKL